MFVENQLSVFLKKLFALPIEMDPFLLCIRYVLDNKNKISYYNSLLQYAYTSVAEILVCLLYTSIFGTVLDKRLNSSVSGPQVNT